MPTYDYVNTETGELVERTVSLAMRDAMPPEFQRITVNAVAVPRGAGDPGAVEQAVPRALRSLESTMPASAIARGAGHSVAELKRVWKV